jgi:hypothetical protein
LAIDDGGGGTGFPANRFAAFYIRAPRTMTVSCA